MLKNEKEIYFKWLLKEKKIVIQIQNAKVQISDLVWKIIKTNNNNNKSKITFLFRENMKPLFRHIKFFK